MGEGHLTRIYDESAGLFRKKDTEAKACSHDALVEALKMRNKVGFARGLVTSAQDW
jgi:hypothetical protein